MLMDFMRRNTKNFLIIITILIVPAFVLWGSFPSLGNKGSDTLLVVGNEKISLENFEQYYGQLREMARMNMGDNFSPELEKMLNLKQQALDGITREILLKKEADRLKIVVSDQEIQDSLKQNPAFYTDGEFDATKWNAAIKDPRINWPAFIEEERQNLRNQKLMEVVYAGARVTEDEVKEEYRRQNEKVRIAYVNWRAADLLAEVELTEEEILSYYENHKSEYKTTAQVKLDYVEMKKEPSEMDFADIEAYAKGKLEAAKGGADFAGLAQAYSDDPATKTQGGDLGFIKRGAPLSRDIEETAFSLKPGEISDVVRADDGFHIIKVEETRGSGAAKEVRVSDIFFKVSASDDTLLSLQERATSISFEAAQSSLKDAASKMQVDVKTTPLFEENSRVIPLIGPVREISEILPGLEQGKTSSVIETPTAFYVAQVVERQPERIPELAEVKEKVSTAAKTEKALELAKKKAQELVQKVNEKQADLVELDPKAQEALPFTRRGYPPELPRVEGLVEAVFALEKGKSAGPFADSKRASVVQLKDKSEPDPADYELQKENIEQRILAQRKQELFQEYYEHLKERVGVEINQELLQTI
jgi:peptidyl-prolyl cis-trans isomerase D